ncbi:hypothetical protein [Spiroplasma endosymbiont of Danaus chrysippus]|nr:hypothetical protein [Spiroplasma endosymbiont of Danaus chrysippus]
MFSCKTPGNSISKQYSESFSKTSVFGKNVLSRSLLEVKG